MSWSLWKLTDRELERRLQNGGKVSCMCIFRGFAEWQNLRQITTNSSTLPSRVFDTKVCVGFKDVKSQNPLIWSCIDLHYLRELILRENKLLRTVFLDVFEVYFTIDRSLIKIIVWLSVKVLSTHPT